MPVLFDSVEQRDTIYSVLLKNGVNSRKYFFPLTVNFDYFKKVGVDLVEKYNLVNANSIASRVLCLPLYPNLDVSTVDRIASLILKNI